jgi:aprataxin
MVPLRRTQVNGLKPSTYEHILKEPLVCFRCNTEMKNMPTLKAHLLEEWEILEKRAKLTSRVKTRKTPDATDYDGGALAEPEGNREGTDEALQSSEK